MRLPIGRHNRPVKKAEKSGSAEDCSTERKNSSDPEIGKATELTISKFSASTRSLLLPKRREREKRPAGGEQAKAAAAKAVNLFANGIRIPVDR